MNRNKPLVAVVIPTFNRCVRVALAVESVRKQTIADWECVVVDDGSTDGTEAALMGLDVRVRVVRQENRGVSAARNRGVRETSGEWLAFLDSDDVWHETKLARQLEFLQERPECRICQTNEIWIRHDRRVNAMKKHRKGEGDCFARSLERCVISPSTVMLRQGLFDEAGGFDEDFPVCEDYDLWLRVTCRESVGLVAEALTTKYGGHADQLSRSQPAMDRFRVRALEKILRSGGLNARQAEQTLAELQRKCEILGAGAEKRGRVEEGAAWRKRATALRGQVFSGPI